jgi:hypothetical protein
MVPVGEILNTVPRLFVPPDGVVLYSFPSRPCAIIPEYAGASGSPLLVPKLYSTEKVWAERQLQPE